MDSRVYIGCLSNRAAERDIHNFFRGFGLIREIVVKSGYGFVQFDHPRDAKDAVYELNGKDLKGQRVSLEMARFPPRGREYLVRRYCTMFETNRQKRNPNPNSKYGPPTITRYKLFVKNLSTRCSWQDLKDLMRVAGEVTYADVHKRDEQNIGYVCFASCADLDAALDSLDGKKINGKAIKLIDGSRSSGRSWSRSRRCSKQGDRSRSHSRSKSRSRSRKTPKSPVEEKSQGSNSKSRSRSKEHSKSPTEFSKSPQSTSRSRSQSEEKEREST